MTKPLPILLRSLLALAVFMAGSVSLSAQCTVSAGELAIDEDGNDIFFRCVDDGESDALTPIITGATEGAIFLRTTAAGFIVGLPTGPDFEFEGTTAGVTFLYQIAVGSDFTGEIGIGDNICNLTEESGCFDLSNSITLNLRSGEGCDDICDALSSEIALSDGSVSTTICSDGTPDPLGVVMIGEFSGEETTFVITDLNGNILAIPAGTGPFDLDPAGPGTCVIWYIAYDTDLEGLEVGQNLDDLDGCFDLSNGLTITRQRAVAGDITLISGSTDTTICIDGIPNPLNVVIDTFSAGEFNQVVITDQATDEILALPEGAGPFDLEGAGGGVCQIYNLSFNNLQGLAVGNTLSDLSGCFDLSAPITVTRNANEAGSIQFDDGSEEVTICLNTESSVVQAVRTDDTEGVNLEYFITDADGMILGTGNETGTFDVGAAGAGSCVIYSIAYSEVAGLEMGQNVADLEGCFDLSNGITTVRNAAEGGTIALADGSDEITICLDTDSSVVTVSRTEEATGDNIEYFITDADGMILGTGNETGTFDVGPAGAGSCVIYSIAYDSTLTGLMMGQNVADLGGCFDLSNGVTTIRVEGEDCPDFCAAEGGTIALADGSDEITICLDTDSSVVTVSRTEEATGDSIEYFITDADGMILGTGNETGTFDVGPAGAGSCVIYSIAYDSTLTGLMMGQNVADLGGCFDLSNGVTTIRVGGEDCDGDGLTFDNVIINEIGADGRIEILNPTSVMIDVSSFWMCSNFQYAQLNTLTLECGDFMLAPGETVVVSNFGPFVATDSELGLYSTNSFGSSDAIISYIRYGGVGGGRSGLAVQAGIWAEGGTADEPTETQSLQTFTDDELTWVLAGETFCEENDTDGFAPGDVFVSEISSLGEVEIENRTDEAVDVSEFRLGSQAAGVQALNNLPLVCGSLMLAPGEVVVVDASSVVNNTDSEVVLFSEAATNRYTLLSYLVYGTLENGLFTNLAVTAGAWTEGLSLTAPGDENTLQVFVENDELTYSNISNSICEQNDKSVSTNAPAQLNGVTLFPNPVGDELNLRFETLSGQQTQLQITDLRGRTVLNRTLNVSAGTTAIQLPETASGTFFLRVINDGKVATLRFVRK